MREESVARRYAAALFAQAKKQDNIVAIRDDLRSAVETVEGSPILMSLLNQPLVTEARKKEAVATALQGRVQPATFAVINLLIDKRRATLLRGVYDEYERLVREYQNIAFATAVTAVPLTEPQKAALEKSLEARTGKDIELKTEVDPAIMGGVLVRIGDTVLDGTVRGKLERLREQLLAR
jgi:ATP synthase, F1 delta subunit